MRISKLVEALEKLRSQKGDLRVQVYNYGDVIPFPVAELRVCGENSVEPYVLVEP